jgi:hypothetical protein
MKNRSLALVAALLGVAWAPAARADQELAKALEKVSKDQIAAFNQEDVAATMGYAHTKSPSYDEARAELTSYFGELDAKAEQVSFQYVGHDDEFALARVKVKVTAKGADGFQDNVVDTITIFHQEGGKWKVWDAYLVGGELVK